MVKCSEIKTGERLVGRPPVCFLKPVGYSTNKNDKIMNRTIWILLL